MAVRELPKGTEIFFFFLNLKSSLGACSRQLMKFIFFLYIYPAECIAPFLYWLLFIWVADFGVDAPSLRSVLLCHVGITWVEEAIKSKLTSIEKPCQNFQKLSVCVCAVFVLHKLSLDFSHGFRWCSANTRWQLSNSVWQVCTTSYLLFVAGWK